MTDSPPLISVITVCYNAANFIEQTIQSVIAQTYPNIEYIVIDGGSSDSTVDIIRQYESHLSYWHSQPDRGITHAFNIGFNCSHGDWILYLNADDFFWESGTLAKAAPYLVKYHYMDVVFGELIFMTREKDPKPQPMRKIAGHSWRWQEFRRHNTLPHQSAFTNRKYFERVGPFDESFRVGMDYEFFLRGGKNLQVRFIPVRVSGMRDGGHHRKNIIDTYQEFRIAQRLNKALPKGLDWVNFVWQISRFSWGQLAHLILDPLASYVNWKGRNTKKIMRNH
jgi:glycosyltransferase involved in cell wall biosynthesis